MKGMCFGCLGIFLPILFLVNFLASNASKDLVVSLLGKPGYETLNLYLVSSKNMWKQIACMLDPSSKALSQSSKNLGGIIHNQKWLLTAKQLLAHLNPIQQVKSGAHAYIMQC